MPTLVISDIHLGSASRSDVLRVPALREPLLELAKGAERVVLLGDLLELRHGPARDALVAARPFIEELGQALAGSELVIVAGNHDHLMIEPWLAKRGEREDPDPLGLEQLIEPRDASPIARRPARRSSVAETSARSGPRPARLSAATASGKAPTIARRRSLVASDLCARPGRASSPRRSPAPPSARQARSVVWPSSRPPTGRSRLTAARHA